MYKRYTYTCTTFICSAKISKQLVNDWFLAADVMNEASKSGTMSSLSSREIFNNNNDTHSNNNNNGATTITRYIHIKHADSSVKIFRETTVWYWIYYSYTVTTYS